MSSKLILYFTAASPPARATLLLARYLNLDVELKEVSLLTGEQHSEEFAKLNPNRKVPVLIDGDFVLTESRAILAYLVNSRKPGSDLYPTEPKASAKVDQRLYYDATIVFGKLAALVVSLCFQLIKINYLQLCNCFQRPGIFGGVKICDQQLKDDVREVLKVLNGFLDGAKYFAGDKLTIADFSIVTNVASFAVSVQILNVFFTMFSNQFSFRKWVTT